MQHYFAFLFFATEMQALILQQKKTLYKKIHV